MASLQRTNAPTRTCRRIWTRASFAELAIAHRCELRSHLVPVQRTIEQAAAFRATYFEAEARFGIWKEWLDVCARCGVVSAPSRLLAMFPARVHLRGKSGRQYANQTGTCALHRLVASSPLRFCDCAAQIKWRWLPFSDSTWEKDIDTSAVKTDIGVLQRIGLLSTLRSSKMKALRKHFSDGNRGVCICDERGTSRREFLAEFLMRSVCRRQKFVLVVSADALCVERQRR